MISFSAILAAASFAVNSEVPIWHAYKEPSRIMFPIGGSSNIGFNRNAGGYVLLNDDGTVLKTGKTKDKGYVINIGTNDVFRTIPRSQWNVQVLSERVFLVRQGFSTFVLNRGIAYIGPEYTIGVNSSYPVGAFGATRDGSNVVFINSNGSGVSMLRRAKLAERGYYFTNDSLPLSSRDFGYCSPLQQYSTVGILNENYGAFVGAVVTNPSHPLKFHKAVINLPMIDTTTHDSFPKFDGLLFVVRFSDGNCVPVAQVKVFDGPHMAPSYGRILVDDNGANIHIESNKGIFRLSTKSLIEAFDAETGVKICEAPAKESTYGSTRLF